MKNTDAFIQKIRNRPIPDGYLLVTADVKSLYTNMNIKRIMQTVKETLQNAPQTGRPDKILLELLRYTLTHNDFTFDNKQYLQIYGTAMGKIYAPSLANIYMQEFDNKAVDGYDITPEEYCRFLDDIFFIWSAGIEELKKFEAYLNTLIPDIEISFEFSHTHINFLDTTVYIHNNTLQTRVYFKPTDTHQLLHTSSYHPKHTFHGILKSQFIRFKRLSSTFTDYNNTCNILHSYLKNRGYTSSEFRKLKFNIWHTYGTDHEDERTKRNDLIVPIVMNHSSIGRDLVQRYKTIIKQNSRFNDHRLLGAFCIGRNLRQILLRSKFAT